MNIIPFNFRAVLSVIFQAAYILLLLVLPSYLYYLGFRQEIIPAIDICVIFYLCSYRNTSHLTLFFLGLFLDTIYGLPLGVSSFAFIIASILLILSEGYIMVRKYYTNAILFIAYALLILFIRYITTAIVQDEAIDKISLVFHLATTIVTYPIAKMLLQPLKIQQISPQV